MPELAPLEEGRAEEDALEGITLCEECIGHINQAGSHDFDACEACQREWRKLEGRVHVSRDCETCRGLWATHGDSRHDRASCDICYRQEVIHNSVTHNPAYCASCQAEFMQYMAYKQMGYIFNDGSLGSLGSGSALQH
jgi:hypothetical protein